MGAGFATMASIRDGSGKRTHAGINWSPAEKARWTEAARVKGLPLAVWARETLDSAAATATGGAEPPTDLAFLEVADVVRLRAGKGSRTDAIRWAVETMAALLNRRWNVLDLAYGEAVPGPTVAVPGTSPPATESAGRGRK